MKRRRRRRKLPALKLELNKSELKVIPIRKEEATSYTFATSL